MHRDAHSHKGDNGKVAVIGGSRFIHGAPIFNALAAESSGIDTLSLCVPRCHEEAAKSHMLNAFVHAFHGDQLSDADTEPILELIAPLDCVVIGSGIARTGERVQALEDIVASSTCPMVLDATALQRNTVELVSGKIAVLTPHLGELERMGFTPEDLPAVTADSGLIIVVKGHTDSVFGPDVAEEIDGGNAGLTVGGTGDALAGLIAGLIAQKMEPFEATVTACRIIKDAGETLFKTYGYAYTAFHVIGEIPKLLHGMKE